MIPPISAPASLTVRQIYEASNGEATTALYKRLEAIGPVGVIALNLFRAQKCSERAKVYRGRLYKNAAYDRKNWSLTNLATILTMHAEALGIRWGWQCDEATTGYPWVLYVETPSGQCSFHSATRGAGPDYAGEWDGHRNVSHLRIIEWCEQLEAVR